MQWVRSPAHLGMNLPIKLGESICSHDDNDLSGLRYDLVVHLCGCIFKGVLTFSVGQNEPYCLFKQNLYFIELSIIWDVILFNRSKHSYFCYGHRQRSIQSSEEFSAELCFFVKTQKGPFRPTLP